MSKSSPVWRGYHYSLLATSNSAEIPRDRNALLLSASISSSVGLRTGSRSDINAREMILHVVLEVE